MNDLQGLMSNGSDRLLVTPIFGPGSGYSDDLFDFSPGGAAFMTNLDNGTSVDAREFSSINPADSSETLMPSSEPHISLEPNGLDMDAGTTITVDSFLKNRPDNKARKRKTYKTKYRVLSDSNKKTASPEPTDYSDTLQLRSRRVMRAFPGRVSVHTSADTDDDTPVSLGRKAKRQLTRKHGKQKRRRLAERLIDAVVKTSGQPNDELLQAEYKGDLRIPITMEAVPRSLISDKPRKWSLVDPRKVGTPFRVSTFRTTGGEKAIMEQTPTSYERMALHRYTTAVAREAVESSSPCQRKVQRSSLVKKNRVTFCEPLKLDVVSVDAVNRRKCTSKSRTKAATLRSTARRSKARTLLECETLREQDIDLGRRSLNMVPVPIKSYFIANKLDDAMAYSSICPSSDSRSQTDYDSLQATMSPPKASIPNSTVSELPTSPMMFSPIASSDRNEGQAISRLPTSDLGRGSLQMPGLTQKPLESSKPLGKTIAADAQDLPPRGWTPCGYNRNRVDDNKTTLKA